MPWRARLVPQFLQACPHGLTAQMNRANSGLVTVVCVSLHEGADVHTIVPCLQSTQVPLSETSHGSFDGCLFRNVSLLEQAPTV